jgi:hypothetical protein
MSWRKALINGLIESINTNVKAAAINALMEDLDTSSEDKSDSDKEMDAEEDREFNLSITKAKILWLLYI